MQNSSIKRALFLSCVVLMTAACATERLLPSLEITVTPIRFDQKTNYQDQIKTFDHLKKMPDYDSLALDDMRNFLWALHYEALGDLNLSLEYWGKVLMEGHPSLQVQAFKHWVLALDRIMGEKNEAETISTYYWQDSALREGTYSESSEWQDQTDVLKKVTAILGQPPASLESFIENSDDPYLEERAAQYCNNPDAPQWSGFFDSLSEQLLGYWQALVLDCKGQPGLALEKFEAVYDDLAKGQELLSYAYYASKTMIRLQKYLGNRKGTAEAYERAMKLLHRDDFQPSHLNENKAFPLVYERLNMKLWAARYEALLGNYELANTYVQEALLSIKRKRLSKFSRREKRRIIELMAEAYHISAFRISLEQQELDSAALHSQLGAELSPLSNNWKWRFQWYEGWYRYQQGLLSKAQESWKELTKKNVSDVWREKALFWLAYTYKNADENSAYLSYQEQLYREFPFSFYTIYSAIHLAWMPQNQWSTSGFQERLAQWDLDITALAENSDLNVLHQRMLFAIKLGNKQIIQAEILALYRQIRKQISRKNLDVYLYVSRLLLVAHQYRLAMGLSYELSQRFDDLWERYPEQILVSFPNAYFQEIKSVAKENDLNPYLLLALIRQESAFDKEATSWIGAKGLLQLMPNTAAKYMGDFSMSDIAIAQSLEEPLFNLQLAGKHLSYLLKHYKGDLFRVCAAYNAGEFVVDRWVNKRPSENELVWLENIPFSETQKYVKFVMRNRLIYERIYELVDSQAIKGPAS